LQNHPLYDTHQVNISKSKNLIPNFAGGSLLRCDKSDIKYYCAILALFKPWRHGKNFKEDDKSQDEAFANYKRKSIKSKLFDWVKRFILESQIKTCAVQSASLQCHTLSTHVSIL